jgi:hypothetical protein
MESKNTFMQENGMEIAENRVYRSCAGDLVKILNIHHDRDQMKVYNISESCHSWHMISRAIRENKFRSEV